MEFMLALATLVCALGWRSASERVKLEKERGDYWYRRWGEHHVPHEPPVTFEPVFRDEEDERRLEQEVIIKQGGINRW